MFFSKNFQIEIILREYPTIRVRTLHIRGCYVFNISSIIYNDGNYNKCWTGFHGNKHAYFRMISSASLYFYSPFFYQFFVVVKLQGDFTFIQSAKIKDFVTDLHVTGAPSSDSATSTYVR